MGWKRSLNFGQSDVLGLDIGSSVVKMIQLRKDNGGYAVTAAGIADIESADRRSVKSEDNGERREINTVRAIRKCLELTKTQTKLAVCGVCGPQIAVRDFKFPSLPPEEIEGAVSLEAAQACPFNAEDGAVDHQLIHAGDDKTSGILVAATNALIKSKVQRAKDASLDCVLIDVDGLALLNCFNAYEKHKAGQPTAVLNVGSSYTNLAIIGNNNWPFIRDMTCAGNDIIKQVAEEKGMSIESVREILCGPPKDEAATQLELHDSLERACHRLTSDVTKTLRYYTAQEKTALDDKIYVCGGFALVKGFVEILNGQLPTKAVLWNPFEKMRCDTGQDYQGILQKNILQKTGPALAVAAGLAMREI